MTAQRHPLLTINLRSVRVSVGKTVLQLEPMEFVYYRYFAERAAYDYGPARLEAPDVAPSGFLSMVAEFHRDLFPLLDSHGEKLEAQLKRGKEITIREFRSKISKINKKIETALASTQDPSRFKIRSTGRTGALQYGLELKPRDVHIIGLTVGKLFRKTVTVFSAKDPLGKALRIMSRDEFDQLVVRHNGELALLTTIGVTNWLAKNLTRPLKSIEETPLSEILLLEPEYNFRVISEGESCIEVRKFFSDRLSKDRIRLQAFLITPNGKKTEDPTGMITPWDFLIKSDW